MKKHAFSLVELLIVMTIIAGISALGLQAFVHIKDGARKQVLLDRIKQFDIAKQQYLTEWGRMEAESNWTSAASDDIRYNFLKRYMERPQFSLADATPQGCTIITPANVHGLYSGTIINDSDGYPVTVNDTQ